LKIVIDTREQKPLDFSRWAEVEVVRGTLKTGDYAPLGYEDRVAIERKSADDLVASVIHGRDRFERELARGRELEHFCIVVECSMVDIARHRYKSKACPESVLQSLLTFQIRYGVPTLWADSPEGASYVVKSLCSKYVRECHKRVGGPSEARLGGSADQGMAMKRNDLVEPFSADLV